MARKLGGKVYRPFKSYFRIRSRRLKWSIKWIYLRKWLKLNINIYMKLNFGGRGNFISRGDVLWNRLTGVDWFKGWFYFKTLWPGLDNPTHSYFHNIELTSPWSILIMQSTRPCIDMDQFCKSLVWLDRELNSWPYAWEVCTPLCAADVLRNMHI